MNDAVAALLFRDARTYPAFLPRPVPDGVLRQVYELARWGPTSMNTQPMRVAFVRSPEGKQRLLRSLNPGNVAKAASAPVTAIVAMDTRFHEMEGKTWHLPGAYSSFAGSPDAAQRTAMRNSSIQGGYLLLAARACGLDCGPMSGFDNRALDEEFFADDRWKSNFLCNLGYGDPASLKPRNGRLAFEDACRLE